MCCAFEAIGVLPGCRRPTPLLRRRSGVHPSGRIKTLTHRLGYATAEFGDLSLEDLQQRVPEIAAWAGTLPVGSRYGIVRALRQALEAAVRWGHIQQNPAKLAGPNPQPKAEEIHPFIQAEIDQAAEDGPAVVFASETGMCPSEWLAIEWRDVDRKPGVVLVERTCACGVSKSYGKAARSRRRVRFRGARSRRSTWSRGGWTCGSCSPASAAA
jgi:integrase